MKNSLKRTFSRCVSVFISVLFLFIAVPAYTAGVSLNATRLVYNQGEKSVSVHARNNTDLNYLSKFFITDSKGSSDVPFIISPPLVKVLKNTSQEARIYFRTVNLPEDRETIFYFNATMIPATDGVVKSNGLSIAYNNIIKLFYRPANLKMQPAEAYENLKIKKTPTGVTVINNSPYYISLNELRLNGIKVGLNMALKNTMISPFSSFDYNVPVNARSGLAEWKVVNDLGGEDVFSGKIQ